MLINRGKRANKQLSTYQFFQFDPKHFDETVVEKLLKAATEKKERAEKIIYSDVLRKIKANAKNEFCMHVGEFVKRDNHFKKQNRPNCSIANLTPLFFFVFSVSNGNESLTSSYDQFKLVVKSLKDYAEKNATIPNRSEKNSFINVCLNKVNEILSTIGFSGLLTNG